MANLTSVLNTINTVVLANGNNEITADTLRPVLIEMANFVEDKGGPFVDLNTVAKGNLVEAINEALTLINQISAAGIALYAGSFDTYADLITAIPTGTEGQYAFLAQDELLNDGFFEYDWDTVSETWKKETSTPQSAILMKVSGSDFEGQTSLKFHFDHTDFIVEELVGGGIAVGVNKDLLFEGYYEEGTIAGGDLYQILGDYAEANIEIDNRGGVSYIALNSEVVNLTGGYNHQNIAPDTSKVAFQSGGDNIGGHLPIPLPPGAVSGTFGEYYDDPNYTGLRAFLLYGRFDNAGAQKNFTFTSGIANTGAVLKYAMIIAMPLITNNSDEFKLKMKALNANTDFATIHLNTKGSEDDGVTPIMPGLELEACIDIRVQNNENERVQIFISPHWTYITKAITEADYGFGYYIKGQGLGDTLAKTGTAETIIGAPTQLACWDAEGNRSELPVSLLYRRASLTGQYQVPTSNAWVTQDNLQGMFDAVKTAIAGTAATPVYHWGNMGVGYFKAGTVLKELRMFNRLRFDDRGVDDIQVDVSYMKEAVPGVGWNITVGETIVNVLPPTNLKGVQALGLRLEYIVSLSDFVLPVDCVVMVAFKGIGTITSTDDWSVNGDLIYQDPFPEI